MKWNILNKLKIKNEKIKIDDEIVKLLLKNRGIVGKKKIDSFLSPPSPYNLKPIALGINTKQLAKALARIDLAIKGGESIVVYGDYDVDGICGTAILWETLRDLGAKVMPFIPQREKEGYGLSIEGIKTILAQEKYGINKDNKRGLLITVDNGIVANKAVEFAYNQGLEVIIVDHHEKPEKLPKAHSIVTTNLLCAAGISYYLALKLTRLLTRTHDRGSHGAGSAWLELAALATVADLVPLLGPNRSLVKHGFEVLNKTERPGLRALYNLAGIDKVGTYEIGYIIGPRINASGRVENALTALRLLCTRDLQKAREYAQILDRTNRERQAMTEEMTLHAVGVQNQKSKIKNQNERIIVIEHESYHQGVIGLIAGKLVEKYYLPAIVISKGESLSKASARSINGFNIIEAIRQCNELLVDAGGHPMAAGFTLETKLIAQVRERISRIAQERINDQMLERRLRVDCELDLGQITHNIYNSISKLEPYGLGNPEPVFASTARVVTIRTVGQDGKHLKLTVSSGNKVIEAIGFGMGSLFSQIKLGDEISIAYSVYMDNFNSNEKLQLKIKDIHHG